MSAAEILIALITSDPPVMSELQTAISMSEALQATELIFIPLGREYPSRDLGLLPLGRSLLLQLAITELGKPGSNFRSAKPHLTDTYATPEGLEILVKKLIQGHTRTPVTTVTTNNPVTIPSSESPTVTPRITVLVPPGIHQGYIEHTPIISDVVRVLSQYKADIAILGSRSRLSTTTNASSTDNSTQVHLPTCSELLKQRGLPHKDIDYDGPTQGEVIRMLADVAKHHTATRTGVSTSPSNPTDAPSLSATASSSSSLPITAKNVLPSTVLSCLQRHGLYSQTIDGYPSRAYDPFYSIAGWYKHENLREISSTTAAISTPSRTSTSTKRPQIGIFGGSFSPITNGHLKIAHQVAVNGNLDEVWIVPCGPRLDKSSLTVDPIHRHAMSVLGVEETYPVTAPVRVVPLEMREPVALSSYELMTRLAVTFPFADFSLIIGADLVPNLGSWRNAQQLLRTVHFLIVPRAGYDLHVPTEPSITSSSEDRKRVNEETIQDHEKNNKRNRTEEISENFDANLTANVSASSSSSDSTVTLTATTNDHSERKSTNDDNDDASVLLTQPRYARYLTHLQDGSPLVSIKVSSKYVRERITEALANVRTKNTSSLSSSSSSLSSTSETTLSSSPSFTSVSSLLINDTQERQAVAEAIKGLVPDAVINYICHNRIYFS